MFAMLDEIFKDVGSFISSYVTRRVLGVVCLIGFVFIVISVDRVYSYFTINHQPIFVSSPDSINKSLEGHYISLGSGRVETRISTRVSTSHGITSITYPIINSDSSVHVFLKSAGEKPLVSTSGVLEKAEFKSSFLLHIDSHYQIGRNGLYLIDTTEKPTSYLELLLSLVYLLAIGLSVIAFVRYSSHNNGNITENPNQT